MYSGLNQSKSLPNWSLNNHAGALIASERSQSENILIRVSSITLKIQWETEIKISSTGLDNTCDT